MSISEDLLRKLGVRVEDRDNNDFPVDEKYDALTEAQRSVASQLRNEYLGELERIKNGVKVTEGVVPITAAMLGYEVINGGAGIDHVRATGGNFLTPLKAKDQRKAENEFYESEEFEPTWVTYGMNLIINPPTLPLVDVWFKRVPGAISATSEPVMNSSLHDIIVIYAASILFNSIGNEERRDAEANEALKRILILNGRFDEPKPVGKKDPEEDNEEKGK